MLQLPPNKLAEFLNAVPKLRDTLLEHVQVEQHLMILRNNLEAKIVLFFANICLFQLVLPYKFNFLFRPLTKANALTYLPAR
jgi:hypothetical protein